ncbi:hypothetical protein KC335_g100 [Hortaea werneckii]|nr:hypothetical protein KC335_g100 [Hortaea werneckii]
MIELVHIQGVWGWLGRRTIEEVGEDGSLTSGRARANGSLVWWRVYCWCLVRPYHVYLHRGVRAPPSARDLLLIDAQFFGMLVHPEDCVDAILNRCGKGVLGCFAVLNTDDDGMDFVHHGPAPACIVHCSAQSESTAVEVQHHRVLAPSPPSLAFPPHALRHIRELLCAFQSLGT